jgi:arylsulfatase A-like enzyme
MSTVLITVDALRADHLAQYGYERDTMPVLEMLTEDGTVFENAYSNAPYTRVSVPAIQTSRYLGYDNLEQLPTMGSILSDEGVRTAIVGTQTGINLVDGAFGYDEMVDMGRDEFHNQANADRPLRERVGRQVDSVAESIGATLRKYGSERVVDLLRTPYRMLNPSGGFRYLGYTSAAEVTDRAIEWLEQNADDDFFLWIHYMEAHRPFGVHDESPAYTESAVSEDEMKELLKKARMHPERISKEEHQTLINLYDSDIRYCSRQMERLFEFIKEAGIWESTDIVLSSDHGEEFNEHGMYNHGNYPYEELITVPLVLKTTRERSARVADERELVDIAPTILAFHGVDPEQYSFDGEHLFTGDSRDVFVLGQPKDHEPAVTIRRYPWKYIHTETDPQLYNLQRDPGEQTNLVSERTETVSELNSLIPKHLQRREIKQIREPEDDVDRQQLAALGYLDE